MNSFRDTWRSIRKTDLLWRYASNLIPSLSYGLAPAKELTAVEKNIVADLDRHGIAVNSIDALLDNDSAIRDWDSAIGGLIADKSDQVTDLKRNAGNEATVGNKTFNLEILGSEVLFDPESICARLGLHGSLLNIANSYFRMFVKLRYYNLWYTAATNLAARESQLWHFDREDNYILKVFLYLEDVYEGTGPFTYAPGTHPKGIHASLQPHFMLEGNVRRTTDEAMANVYPRSDWKVCTGKKGTIIFADTRGYHKGGEARTGDRLMFTCMYTSPASQSKDLIRFPTDFDPAWLSSEQIRALRIPRK